MKRNNHPLNFPAARRRRWFTMLDLMLLPGLVYLIINNYIPMRPLYRLQKSIILWAYLKAPGSV